MSNADVETIRAIYAALAAGDVGPLADCMHEAIEWHEPLGAPVVAGTFHGRAQVLSEVLARMPEVWEEVRVTPQEFMIAGEFVIVTGCLAVLARGTGGRAEAPFVHFWELREGQIVSWRCHTDTALLQAARVSR